MEGVMLEMGVVTVGLTELRRLPIAQKNDQSLSVLSVSIDM